MQVYVQCVVPVCMLHVEYHTYVYNKDLVNDHEYRIGSHDIPTRFNTISMAVVDVHARECGTLLGTQ